MPGLGRNTQLPEGLLHIAHKVEHARTDGAEIVVFQLLVLGGRCAEQGSAGLDEVRSQQEKVLIDEEILLLHTQRDSHLAIAGAAEALHQAPGGSRKSLYGAQQRCLLIQRLTGITAEGRGNTERGAIVMPLDKGRAGRVPCRVTARFERGAEATGGEAGGIRLAYDEVLAGKRKQGLAATWLQKRIMFFGSPSGERLKPVGIAGCAPGHGPFLHGMCHISGNRRIERLSLLNGL